MGAEVMWCLKWAVFIICQCEKLSFAPSGTWRLGIGAGHSRFVFCHHCLELHRMTADPCHGSLSVFFHNFDLKHDRKIYFWSSKQIIHS
jgi:hypothetical protein